MPFLNIFKRRGRKPRSTPKAPAVIPVTPKDDFPEYDRDPHSVAEDNSSEAARKKMWESKFEVHPVVYNAQDKKPRDIRNFIFSRSYILEDVIYRYKLKGVDDNDTMLKCCLFVQDRIKYVSDSKSRSQTEYWQNPEDTVARKTGDCEDGAILMKSLTLIAGVPDWKVKIVAGHVKGGGHAYCTYITDDDRQVIMDWCYWPTRVNFSGRKTIKEDDRYGEVWFSFNYRNTYSGKSKTYS